VDQRALTATALAAACLFAPARAADSAAEIRIGVTDTPVHLDGILDEEAWRHAAIIQDLTQQDPKPGEPTPFTTEIRIVRDARFIYIAAICRDPDPDKIAIHTMLRDGSITGDDSIAVIFDTFEDGRTGFYFAVNAAGARVDALVSGSGDPSLDWDGIWDARARRTAEGWTAEIAIPARTLRFAKDGARWGFNVERHVPRTRLVTRWTGTTLDASFYDLKRAGKLAGVDGFRQGTGLSVSPYVLGRRTAEFDPQGTSGGGEAGIDVTENFDSGFSAVGTLNTDFAETEVDTRQINLTRFPLFFPEKRTFFLEGSNQFDFGGGLGLDVDFIPFFSRRIGLFQGHEVPILGGAKLVGQRGPFGIGILDTETGDTPRTRATNLFSGMTTLDASDHLRFAAMATVGDPDGAGQSWLGGLNAVYRTEKFLGDKNFIAGAWSARSGGDPAGTGDRGGFGAHVEYPNDLWSLYATFRDFGDALEPALGFLPRPGTRQYEVGGAYQPRPGSAWWSSWARQFYYETFARYITDLDGQPESWDVFVTPFNVGTKGGGHTEVNWDPTYERLIAPFEISPGVVIPPGDYHFTRYRFELQTSLARRLRAGTSDWFGEFYDGKLTQLGAFVSYTSREGHVSVLLNTENDLATLPEGDFTDRLFLLRAVFAATPDLVFSSNAQYDSTSRELGFNNRVRYTIRPGTDLYVVWNRGWIRPFPDPGDLTLGPQSDEIVVKLRHTWRP